MHIAFADLVPGLAAGAAIAGAWLTAVSFFRSDKRIRLEDATYHDGGATRIALQMESARLGRIGVVLTAAAIVLPLLWSPSTALNRHESMMVAILTAAACCGLAWVRLAYFRYVAPPPELAMARGVLAANQDETTRRSNKQ